MAYDPADWDTADETAKTTAQHFFTDPNGAHVTETAGNPNAGNNVLIDSGGMFVRDGTTNVAQFKNPTIIGETGAGHPNVLIGMDGGETGVFIRDGSSPKLIMWEQPGVNGGYIQSGDGCYLNIYDGSLYVTPFGQPRFTILDQNNQSGFCIGGFHVYTGTFTANVGTNQTSYMAWTASTFRSTFNVSSGHESDCFVTFVNGNVALGSKGTITAEWWPSSYNPYGWRVRWQNQQSGSQRFNYLVVVPDSYSTV